VLADAYASCGRSSTDCRSSATCRPTTSRRSPRARAGALARSRRPRRARVGVRTSDHAGPRPARAAVHRPLLEAFAGPAAPRPGVDREATQELLAGLGFERPAASTTCSGRWSTATRLGKVLAHLFPVMAPALALSANPMGAGATGACSRGGLRLPGDRRRARVDPTAARRLAHLVAASSFATDLLATVPSGRWRWKRVRSPSMPRPRSLTSPPATPPASSSPGPRA
jgi:hypothetical protein